MAADVTALIAVYNGAALVRRAIESVLRQTVPVAEIVVVDDGSTDGTGDAVRAYGERVRYLRQDNRGVAAARNAGIRAATSTWIAFLDHDDEWLPEKTELQMECLRSHPTAALCYSAYRSCGLDGNARLLHIACEDLPKVVRFRNPFPPSVVIARRDVLLSLGGFDENLRGATCEDWDLHARFTARQPVVALGQPLANYYEVASSNSLRQYRLMLTNSLAIVEPTLLAGLEGVDRWIWRRRIQSKLYHHAAISARRLGDPALGLLMSSLLRWPAIDSRIATLALELQRILRRSWPSHHA
jgi:glycosyltransferase involved in cell wall biosynthesis